MVKAYLNQTAKWGKRIGANEHGEPIFTERNVKCRIEQDNRISETMGGEKAQWDTRVYLTQKVQIGDNIDGLRVKAVEILTDINGGEEGRVVTI